MLVEHVGWKRLMEIADGQIATRMPVVMKPLTNLLEVGTQEFEKGEASGIKRFCGLPEFRISELKGEIDRLNEEMEDERELETSPAAGGASDDGGDFERPSP
jgi:hypothetical protein